MKAVFVPDVTDQQYKNGGIGFTPAEIQPINFSDILFQCIIVAVFFNSSASFIWGDEFLQQRKKKIRIVCRMSRYL